MKGYVVLCLLSTVTAYPHPMKINISLSCPFGALKDEQGHDKSCGGNVGALCPEKCYCHKKEGSTAGVCCKEFKKSCKSGKQSGDICGTIRGLPCPAGFACLTNPQIADDWGICCPEEQPKSQKKCEQGTPSGDMCGTIQALPCPADFTCVTDPLVKDDEGICCPKKFVKRCSHGDPSGDICGTISALSCPAEHRCVTNPAVADDWGICCPDVSSSTIQCKVGEPLVDIVCGTFKGVECPKDYMCITRSKWADDAGVCCPLTDTFQSPNRAGIKTSLRAQMGILRTNNNSLHSSVGNTHVTQAVKYTSNTIGTKQPVNEGSNNNAEGTALAQSAESSNTAGGENVNETSANSSEHAETGSLKNADAGNTNQTTEGAAANQEVEVEHELPEIEEVATPASTNSTVQETVQGENNTNEASSPQSNSEGANNVSESGGGEFEAEEIQNNAAANDTVTPPTTLSSEQEAEELNNVTPIKDTVSPPTTEEPPEIEAEPQQEYHYVYRYWW